MTNIIEKIETITDLDHATGCSIKQVKEAQEALGIEFPEAYIEYVRTYGVISFYATEWTGLNVYGYLNTVEVTKQERDANPYFPSDCFVLENMCIDDILTIVNERGQVFTLQYEKKSYLCESMEEYLDICIARRNDK